MNKHAENERALYRTYLADLVSAVVILWGGETDDKRSSLPVVLIGLAVSFCFWGSMAAYFIYIWFIK